MRKWVVSSSPQFGRPLWIRNRHSETSNLVAVSILKTCRTACSTGRELSRLELDSRKSHGWAHALGANNRRTIKRRLLAASLLHVWPFWKVEQLRTIEISISQLSRICQVSTKNFRTFFLSKYLSSLTYFKCGYAQIPSLFGIWA